MLKTGPSPPRTGSSSRGSASWDGEATAFVVSLILHLGILVGLGLAPIWLPPVDQAVTITAPRLAPEDEPQRVPEEFHFSEQPAVEIGAHSATDTGMALSLAADVSDVSEVPSPNELTPAETPRIEINHAIEAARGLHFDAQLAVRGAAGEGVRGAMGAVDRITQEILLSLEERKTLVVWLFDQSASMLRTRDELLERFDRIYAELGALEAAGNAAFRQHEDQPLLTSVVAFGQQVSLRTPQPTADVALIKKLVREIERDDSGVERVFSSVFMAVDEYKKFRVPDRFSKEPDRNVLLIVLTDEVGEDQEGVDETVRVCRRYEIPVYVIGVPAPFGLKETLVKWVDPDPNFDQSPQWGRVDQGPESLLPEFVRLRFSGREEDLEPIDSGFGPFALTRLAYETGGIFFAVHPNRNVNRAVSRGETAAFAAHLRYFFDPDLMRKYRPDYVSTAEYARRAAANKARAALLEAAKASWLTPLESPALEFVKRDEAEFTTVLTEAQKEAARLEPKVLALWETLKLGETDRPRELSPRWQAGYDLAMGRALAVLVRTQAYNAMLAAAKRGLKFSDPKNNTWRLTPADEIHVGSQLEKLAARAREYLERVEREHAGTPWALLAQQELATPLGWKWTEQYTELAPPPRPATDTVANNPPPRPRDDQARMLPPPKPRREPPKL